MSKINIISYIDGPVILGMIEDQYVLIRCDEDFNPIEGAELICINEDSTESMGPSFYINDDLELEKGSCLLQ